jgi:hypothetical protein
MKNRLKRISDNGDVITIFKSKNKNEVLEYMQWILENNTFQCTYKKITYIDGSKGYIKTKNNGAIIQYKLELAD